MSSAHETASKSTIIAAAQWELTFVLDDETPERTTHVWKSEHQPSTQYLIGLGIEPGVCGYTLEARRVRSDEMDHGSWSGFLNMHRRHNMRYTLYVNREPGSLEAFRLRAGDGLGKSTNMLSSALKEVMHEEEETLSREERMWEMRNKEALAKNSTASQATDTAHSTGDKLPGFVASETPPPSISADEGKCKAPASPGLEPSQPQSQNSVGDDEYVEWQPVVYHSSTPPPEADHQAALQIIRDQGLRRDQKSLPDLPVKSPEAQQRDKVNDMFADLFDLPDDETGLTDDEDGVPQVSKSTLSNPESIPRMLPSAAPATSGLEKLPTGITRKGEGSPIIMKGRASSGSRSSNHETASKQAVSNPETPMKQQDASRDISARSSESSRAAKPIARVDSNSDEEEWQSIAKDLPTYQESACTSTNLKAAPIDFDVLSRSQLDSLDKLVQQMESLIRPSYAKASDGLTQAVRTLRQTVKDNQPTRVLPPRTEPRLHPAVTRLFTCGTTVPKVPVTSVEGERGKRHVFIGASDIRKEDQKRVGDQAVGDLNKHHTSTYGLKPEDVIGRETPIPYLAICPPNPMPTSPSQASEASATSSALSDDSLQALRLRYLTNLRDSRGTISAAGQVYQIIIDEQINLDSSLGLKLMDLATSFYASACLETRPTPVTPALAVSGGKPDIAVGLLQKVLEKLNDHSEMLNVIAEATGVNLLDENGAEDSEGKAEKLADLGNTARIDPAVCVLRAPISPVESEEEADTTMNYGIPPRQHPQKEMPSDSAGVGSHSAADLQQGGDKPAAKESLTDLQPCAVCDPRFFTSITPADDGSTVGEKKTGPAHPPSGEATVPPTTSTSPVQTIHAPGTSAPSVKEPRFGEPSFPYRPLGDSPVNLTQPLPRTNGGAFAQYAACSAAPFPGTPFTTQAEFDNWVNSFWGGVDTYANRPPFAPHGIVPHPHPHPHMQNHPDFHQMVHPFRTSMPAFIPSQWQPFHPAFHSGGMHTFPLAHHACEGAFGHSNSTAHVPAFSTSSRFQPYHRTNEVAAAERFRAMNNEATSSFGSSWRTRK